MLGCLYQAIVKALGLLMHPKSCHRPLLEEGTGMVRSVSPTGGVQLLCS